MERTFEFKVTLVGRGETEADAWRDAVDAFCQDPGEPQSTVEIDDEMPDDEELD